MELLAPGGTVTFSRMRGLPFKERFFPAGPDDGTKRIRLSTVRPAADASQLTDLTWPPFDAPPDAVVTREPAVFA